MFTTQVILSFNLHFNFQVMAQTPGYHLKVTLLPNSPEKLSSVQFVALIANTYDDSFVVLNDALPILCESNTIVA